MLKCNSLKILDESVSQLEAMHVYFYSFKVFFVVILILMNFAVDNEKGDARGKI